MKACIYFGQAFNNIIKMQKLFYLIFFSFVLNVFGLAQTKICLPLAGIYTINPSQATANRNFNSITHAIEALKCGGISDSVRFEIASGIYKEAFIIPKIDGSSEQNAITFISQTRNADDVILSPDTIIHEAFPFMFYFYNCNNLNFASLTFKVTNNENAVYFFYFENTNNINFKQNKFENLNFNENCDFFLFLFQSSENIEISNNDFQIKQTALAFENTLGIVIKGNYLKIEEGNDAIKLNLCKNAIISKNKFIATGTENKVTALAFLLLNQQVEVSKNIFLIEANSVECIQNSVGKGIFIYNNFFKILAERHANAIDVGDENVKILHNTFFVESKENNNSTCIDIFRANNGAIENNIFCSKVVFGLHGLTSDEIEINNNCYSTDSLSFALYNYSDFKTFNEWKEQTGFDSNSIISDVNFLSETDLHLQEGQDFLTLNNPLAEVNTDIDGDIRSATMPYYGADELLVDLSFSIDNNCIEKPLNFSVFSVKTIKSILWNFGDSHISTEQNPTHNYALPGKYTVTLKVIYNDNSEKTITKQITITEKPEKPVINY